MANDKRQKEFYDVPEDPISEGVIMEGVLSHFVSPKTAISYAENMHNDTIGMMTSRRPFVSRQTVTALPTSCTLYQTPSGGIISVWNQGGDFKYQNFDGSGGVVPYNTILSIGNKTRFETILGYLCMTTVSGQPKYFDASGAPTAFGTSFPALGTIDLISFYGGYIWCSDSSNANIANRVYYSDVLPSTFPASVTGGSLYLTVNARNGDRITGFASTQNLLYVFCHNSIFRISSPTSIDNSPIAQVGTFSQESIVRTKAGFFFFHPSGIYQLTEGGTPKEISIKIRDIINAIPNTNHGSVFGWSDDDHVYFSIGKGLQGYQVNKSYILRYTISTQVWTIYSTLSFLPKCGVSGNFASSATIDSYSIDVYPANFIMGVDLSDTGAVGSNYYGGTFNNFIPSTENSSLSSDWGSIPISVDVQSNWLNFGIEEHAKRANGLFISSENATGLKVAYQIDNDLPDVWREIGSVSEDYVTSFNSWQSNNFHRIKFRVYGQTNGRTVKVGTPKIRVLDDLGYDSN